MFPKLKTMNSIGSDKFAEQPEKNIFSHIHDANQYLCMYFAPNQAKQNDTTELMKQAMARSRAAAAARNREDY